MNIAVLGGNGYLGHHVTKYFNATPLSRRTGFDITKSKDCEQLKDYDVVIHMATLVDKSEKKSRELFKVNGYGTLNVIKALGTDQTLIFASTKDVDTELTSYAISKEFAELCVSFYAYKQNVRAGIFRLSTTYAPPTHGSNFVNHFVKCIQEGKKITLLMGGEQKRDFLYIKDLSSAFDLFIHNEEASGVFNIGGGECISTTIYGLVKIIEEAVGKKAKICYSDGPVKGQIHYVSDLELITYTLDWQPTITLEEGIRRIL